jgi:hypothetical protein
MRGRGRRIRGRWRIRKKVYVIMNVKI